MSPGSTGSPVSPGSPVPPVPPVILGSTSAQNRRQSNGQTMTRAEIQAIIFIAVSMLVGAFVLLVKQYDSEFLPDLGPAPAGGRANAEGPANAGIRAEPAPAGGIRAAPAPAGGDGADPAWTGQSIAGARAGDGQQPGGHVTDPPAVPRQSDSGYPADQVSAKSASSNDGLHVPVNTAPASELQKLPGIGPKLAAEIIAYRKQSGPFANVEQLLEVKGIGPAKLGRLRPFVQLK